MPGARLPAIILCERRAKRARADARARVLPAEPVSPNRSGADSRRPEFPINRAFLCFRCREHDRSTGNFGESPAINQPLGIARRYRITGASRRLSAILIFP